MKPQSIVQIQDDVCRPHFLTFLLIFFKILHNYYVEKNYLNPLSRKRKFYFINPQRRSLHKQSPIFGEFPSSFVLLMERKKQTQMPTCFLQSTSLHNGAKVSHLSPYIYSIPIEKSNNSPQVFFHRFVVSSFSLLELLLFFLYRFFYKF